MTQHLDGRQQNCHVGSSRPLSLSRLPLRAQFYQKRDVWVRGRCGTQNADSVSGSLSIVCLFYVLLFSRNKILIRKQKNIYLAFYRPLINPPASERFVYIVIHFHLVFQFDRINSLSGNFYLSSLVDFSAL